VRASQVASHLRAESVSIGRPATSRPRARAGQLLDRELATRAFIASERFSIADITALCTVDFGHVIELPPIRLSRMSRAGTRWCRRGRAPAPDVAEPSRLARGAERGERVRWMDLRGLALADPDARLPYRCCYALVEATPSGPAIRTSASPTSIRSSRRRSAPR
jgi:hypothetical protein